MKLILWKMNENSSASSNFVRRLRHQSMQVGTFNATLPTYRLLSIYTESTLRPLWIMKAEILKCLDGNSNQLLLLRPESDNEDEDYIQEQIMVPNVCILAFVSFKLLNFIFVSYSNVLKVFPSLLFQSTNN